TQADAAPLETFEQKAPCAAEVLEQSVQLHPDALGNLFIRFQAVGFAARRQSPRRVSRQGLPALFDRTPQQRIGFDGIDRELRVVRGAQHFALATPELVDRAIVRGAQGEEQEAIAAMVALYLRCQLPCPEQGLLHHDFDVHLAREAEQMPAHGRFGTGDPAGKGLHVTSDDSFQVNVEIHLSTLSSWTVRARCERRRALWRAPCPAARSLPKPAAAIGRLRAAPTRCCTA